MTLFDEIAEKNGDTQWEDWQSRVLSAKQEIADFVARRLPGPGPEVLDWLQGSFNFCLRIMYSDDTPDVIIRFPGPGHTTFRDEKVINEVHVLQFLKENTTIPVPRLISWGLTEESPRRLGPFIISEFVEGVDLSEILKDPASPYKLYLNPKIDESVLDNVFAQIADILLQLYQFDFDRIGAISRSSSASGDTWSVASRPLTYTMNELAATTFYPEDKFPVSYFASASQYFRYLASEHQTHLWTHRNLCNNPAEARHKCIVRHAFSQSIDKYVTADNGLFKLFCDDLRPQNILIDPDNLRIKAVLDLEFTNAMPRQFASEPPWWLILVGPDSYLLRDHTIEDWIKAYEPRLEQFLRVLERVEEAGGDFSHDEDSLSGLMRESWETKRFWFNYAARKPFDVEALFERCVGGGVGVGALDERARAGLEPLVERKMAQLKAHDEECRKSL